MPLPLFGSVALAFAPVKSFIKAIPRPVWIALAVAAAVGLAWWLHRDAVSDARKEGYAAGVKHEGGRIAAKAKRIKDGADRITAGISQALRTKSDEKVRVIYRDADAVFVRGPGKAACGGNPSVPGGSSRPVPPGGQGGAPMAEMPAGEGVDLIGLPFPGTVALAQQCDLNRAEVLSWREWWKQQSAAWAKLGEAR